MVFIIVQNLVKIDAVVSIICMFLIWRVWLENSYSRPQNWGFGGTFPPNDVTHRRDPKRTVLVLNHVI